MQGEETMTVRVRDSEAEKRSWGYGPFHPIIKTVTIVKKCPTCGGPRGDKRNNNRYEDGVHFSVDIWDNVCGHVDYYESVIVEAAALAAKEGADR